MILRRFYCLYIIRFLFFLLKEQKVKREEGQTLFLPFLLLDTIFTTCISQTRLNNVQLLLKTKTKHSTMMPIATPSAVPSFSTSLPVAFNLMEQPKKRLNTKEPLPIGFTPSPYSVICGRSKSCTESVGNRRLKVIAGMFLEKYSNAATKELKSMIVTEIMDILEDACPDQKSPFVKFSDGRWWAIDHMASREKVGALMRDCLHTKYRSSNKSKLARRRCCPTTQEGSKASAPLVAPATKPSCCATAQQGSPASAPASPARPACSKEIDYNTSPISADCEIKSDNLIFGRHFHSLGDEMVRATSLDLRTSPRRPKSYASRCA